MWQDWNTQKASRRWDAFWRCLDIAAFAMEYTYKARVKDKSLSKRLS